MYNVINTTDIIFSANISTDALLSEYVEKFIIIV